MIKEFQGEYRWLSNFWPCKIHHYPSVEHAYQAAKTLDLNQREEIARSSAAAAKQLGKRVTMRKDWNEIKLQVMEYCLRKKFEDPDLRAKLLATDDQYLQEGNKWHDTYWGVYLPTGKGENHLGQLLMKIRSEL